MGEAREERGQRSLCAGCARGGRGPGCTLNDLSHYRPTAYEWRASLARLRSSAFVSINGWPYAASWHGFGFGEGADFYTRAFHLKMQRNNVVLTKVWYAPVYRPNLPATVPLHLPPPLPAALSQAHAGARLSPCHAVLAAIFSLLRKALTQCMHACAQAAADMKCT
jgi:hypothetical protein